MTTAVQNELNQPLSHRILQRKGEIYCDQLAYVIMKVGKAWERQLCNSCLGTNEGNPAEGETRWRDVPTQQVDSKDMNFSRVCLLFYLKSKLNRRTIPHRGKSPTLQNPMVLILISSRNITQKQWLFWESWGPLWLTYRINHCTLLTMSVLNKLKIWQYWCKILVLCYGIFV